MMTSGDTVEDIDMKYIYRVFILDTGQTKIHKVTSKTDQGTSDIEIRRVADMIIKRV